MNCVFVTTDSNITTVAKKAFGHIIIIIIKTSKQISLIFSKNKKWHFLLYIYYLFYLFCKICCLKCVLYLFIIAIDCDIFSGIYKLGTTLCTEKCSTKLKVQTLLDMQWKICQRKKRVHTGQFTAILSLILYFIPGCQPPEETSQCCRVWHRKPAEEGLSWRLCNCVCINAGVHWHMCGVMTVWESRRLNQCGKRTSRNVPSNVIAIVCHSSFCPVLPAITVNVRHTAG